LEAFLAVVHNMVMLVGIIYIAQLITGVFNWPARENNPIYRLFRFLASPVTKAVRVITPAKIADKHVPVVAFALLFWLYIVLIAARLYVKRPELFQ
jgi:uncharacterized protein YggT (Ycf19 family)